MGTILVAFGSVIVGAFLGAYLQKRWTPDARPELLSVGQQITAFQKHVETTDPRPEIIALGTRITSLQQRLETIEQERSELENFSLEISLQRAYSQDCSISVKNSSDREVVIESVNLTYKGVPLSRPGKPKPTDNWRIGPRSNGQINWIPEYPPWATLRWIDPDIPKGRCIVISVVLDCKVGGKPKTITAGQPVTVDFQNGHMTPYGP